MEKLGYRFIVDEREDLSASYTLFLSSLLGIEKELIKPNNHTNSESLRRLTFYVGGNLSTLLKIKERVVWVIPYNQLPSEIESREILEKIWAIIDPTVKYQAYLPLLKLIQHSIGVNIEVWSKEFTNILEQNLAELQRIKTIHEKIVPVREHKTRLGKIYSKYSAGLKSGGDYFDLVQNSNELFVLLLSTHSYLVSSIAMSLSSMFRSEKEISDQLLVNYISSLDSELAKKSLKFDKDENYGLLLLKINLKDMKCRGILMGQTEIITSNKQYYIGSGRPVDSLFIEKSKISFQLSRDEKVFFTSPGVRLNLNGILKGQSLEVSLRNLCKEKDGSSLLNELFFELKKNLQEEDMLKYDATALYLEVDHNAIHTI